MSITICHASISENGNAGWDGKSKAGDQTGKEVCTRTWYSKPWNIMLRYKDATVAKKASQIAKKLANSNLVGYDQSQRNTLYAQLKKCGWDVDKYIKSGVKTETDCSAFMYACYCCVIPAMRSDSNAPTTSTMKGVYVKNGFTAYTDAKYLTKDANLKIGDVLVKTSSHTVMAVTNGASVSNTTTSKGTTEKKSYSVGDTVNYKGNVHYPNAGKNATGKTCKGGKAKITQISKGSAHPYHLVAVKGSGATVYGWVNAGTFN